MLNSSPGRNATCRFLLSPPAAIRRGFLYCSFFCFVVAASAQTLARPGWTASGFTADPWWKHAVFYRMTLAAAGGSGAPGGTAAAPDWLIDAKSTSEKLDALQSLRIDALILPAPEEQTAGPALDAFDDMVSQASRRGIRVVLAIPASGPASVLTERARFWLSRGIAGFYVFTPAQGNPVDVPMLVQMVRDVASAAVGGRIVISDLASEPAVATAVPTLRHRRRRRTRASSSHGSTDHVPAQLRIDSHLNLPELPDAATLRKLIADEPPDSSVVLDIEPPAAPGTTIDPYLAILKAIAAIDLTTHPVALIGADGTLSPALGSGDGAVADWYRQVIALHHGNSTLGAGIATPLDFDAQNALVWVSRAPQASSSMPPVIVVCNLTSSAIHLSLGAAVRGLGLRGSFLRTLLRTDDSMGPQDLDNVSIPAFGVYIGELHR